MRSSLRTIAHLSAWAALMSSACKEAQAKVDGVGDSLRAFIVMNCATSQRYCQVCAYGGKPKIMFVADIDDAAAEKDLLRIQELVDRHSTKGLVAFALFGEIENGKFTPVRDDSAAAEKLRAKVETLKVTYPITIVPSSYTEKEAKSYAAFVDAYDIPSSRRLFYADAKNEVRVAETIADAQADAQFAKVDAAIQELVVTDPARLEEWSEIVRGMRMDLIDARGNVLKKAVSVLELAEPDRPTILSMWASYCPPCVEEIPVFDELHRDGHRVIGVSFDRGSPASFPQGILQSESLKKVGASLPAGLPFTIVLDGQGRARYLFRGAITKPLLTEAIERIRS